MLAGDLDPAAVRDAAGIEHPEQQFAHARVRLVDLVEQHDRVRPGAQPAGEHAVAVVADVARRRADQPRDLMALGELREIDAQQRVGTERLVGQRVRERGLAHARWPPQEDRPDRLAGRLEPEPAPHDAAAQRLDRRLLADHARGDPRLEAGEVGALAGAELAQRDAGAQRGRVSDLGGRHARPALAAQPGARLVEDVDRLVGLAARRQVARGQLDRGVDRRVVDRDAVVLLERRAQPAQDRERRRGVGLGHVDALEPAGERGIARDDAVVLGGGRRADDPHGAPRERRLEHVGRRHPRRAGRQKAVDLVDEHQRPARRRLGDHAPDPVLQLAAIARTRGERGRRHRDDPRAGELRHLAARELDAEPLGDRRLADPGVADEDHVRLGVARQRDDDALEHVFAAERRPDAPPPGLLDQIAAERVEHRRGRADPDVRDLDVDLGRRLGRPGGRPGECRAAVIAIPAIRVVRVHVRVLRRVGERVRQRSDPLEHAGDDRVGRFRDRSDQAMLVDDAGLAARAREHLAQLRRPRRDPAGAATQLVEDLVRRDVRGVGELAA